MGTPQMKKPKRKLSDVALLRKVARPQGKGIRFPRPKVVVRRGFSRG
jgi:hypothetical protein